MRRLALLPLVVLAALITLKGGTGKDKLYGQLGKDKLKGGPGNDKQV
jgi:Ca2+-binding RTX toxin-like protein